MYVCMYVYVYICIYIICMYIHTCTQAAAGREARLDAEARCEALLRLNKDLEKSLAAERELCSGLQGELAALEPQVLLLRRLH